MSTTNAITAPPAQIPPLEPATRRPPVLLVEDDRSLRRYLQVIIERAGYEVVVASDGLEAMKMALSCELSAVVTDAVMPHLGGLELCRFLRRHPQLRSLPIVLLSGVEIPAPLPEGGEWPDSYLSKPVRAEDLTECIGRLLCDEDVRPA